MTPTAEEWLKETGSVKSKEIPEFSLESKVSKEKDYALTFKDNNNKTKSTPVTTASITNIITEEDKLVSNITSNTEKPRILYSVLGFMKMKQTRRLEPKRLFQL